VFPTALLDPGSWRLPPGANSWGVLMMRSDTDSPVRGTNSFVRSQSLGERLRARRHDLTQDEAAAELGVTKSTYQAWESGRAYPDKHRRHAVAAWLREGYDDFVDGVNAEKRSARETELRSELDALRAEVVDLARLVQAVLEDKQPEQRNGRS
jgi:transcriptional regulator with XRE-family HTH domain